MVSFPHCKINLGLHVVSKRNDGYHNIETCFYPVDRHDILEIIPAKEFSFSQSGIKVDGKIDDNLCVKAFRLIQNQFGIGKVKIHLHKIIPMGAGLGGGSSDAAFTFRLLNEIFGLKIKNEQLKSLASELGSDCAFFIKDEPMIGKGRGEILESISTNLKGKYIVMIKPDVHISTAEAYSGIKPTEPSTSIQDALKLPLTEWKTHLKNDFEDTIFQKHPILSEIKERLYSQGATYSSMSGSGATVFGLFEKPVDLKREFASADYWSGELK
jgi:4-diphosphocytidyl-2-C-methyl-D-erythritol kinase